MVSAMAILVLFWTRQHSSKQLKRLRNSRIKYPPYTVVPTPTPPPATPLLAPDLQSLTRGGLRQLRPSRWSAYRTSPHLETRSGPWPVWTGRCSHRWTHGPPYSPPRHRWKTDWAHLQIPPWPEHTEQSTSVTLQRKAGTFFSMFPGDVLQTVGRAKLKLNESNVLFCLTDTLSDNRLRITKRKTYYIKMLIFSGFSTILISQLTFHCFMLLKRQVLIASPVLASIRIKRL